MTFCIDKFDRSHVELTIGGLLRGRPLELMRLREKIKIGLVTFLTVIYVFLHVYIAFRYHNIIIPVRVFGPFYIAQHIY